MKLLSGVLGLTLTSVVALASANAADMYRAPDGGGYKDGPVYAEVNWSGLYAGANAGYGWSANTDYLDPTGAFGGAQIGYNFQRGPVVFGIEADFEGAGITDSNAYNKSEMNWFGTVRGRLGYTFGKALVYGTGGFAFGDVENSHAGATPWSYTDTQTGWVAGAGVEYKLTPNWSGKVEYQYLDLSASDWKHVLGLGNETDTQVHTIRVGVNYFFNTAYAPLK
ncbi:MAG: outer membrane protein [Rhodomicrobium sp.]